MGKVQDLTGQKFGRLTVIEQSEGDKYNRAKWLCKCECGNLKIVRAYDLKSGATKSCGCYNKEHATKHGASRTRLYCIWKTIRSRCFNPKDKDYQKYGACGKTMCEEWIGENGVINFINWSMQSGYKDGLTIDRIDNDKGYSPQNCRWVSMKDQQNNRTNNHLLTYGNETHTISQWAEITGIRYSTLLYRINKGWSVERALETPVK